MRRPRLLVTGFGPFPGMPRNPSEAAARAVARQPRWRILGIEARALVLPTRYAALANELGPALDGPRPDAVLMIGVAGRARHVRVETRAANRASLLLPDAGGQRLARSALEPGAASRKAPAATAAKAVLLRRHGFRAALSRDAGAYLCNAAYFTALARPIPVLFVHIPKPGRAVARGRPRRLAWQASLAAALVDLALDLLKRRRP